MTVLDVSLDNLLGVSKLQEVLKSIIDKLNKQEAALEGQIGKVLVEEDSGPSKSEDERVSRLEERLAALESGQPVANPADADALSALADKIAEGMTFSQGVNKNVVKLEEKLSDFVTMLGLQAHLDDFQDRLEHFVTRDEVEAEMTRRLSQSNMEDLEAKVKAATENLQRAPEERPKSREQEPGGDILTRLQHLEEDTRAEDMAAKLAEIEERLGAAGGGGLDDDAAGRLSQLEEALQRLEAAGAGGGDGSEALEARMEEMRKAMQGGFEEQLQKLSGKMLLVEADVGNHLRSNEDFSGKMDELSSAHEGKTASLQAMCDELQKALAAMQSETASIQGRIATCEDKTTAIEAGVAEVTKTVQVHISDKDQEAEEAERNRVRDALAALEEIVNNRLLPGWDKVMPNMEKTQKKTADMAGDLNEMQVNIRALMSNQASGTTRCLSCLQTREQHQTKNVQVGADGKIYRRRKENGQPLDALESASPYLNRGDSFEMWQSPEIGMAGKGGMKAIHMNGGAGAPLRRYHPGSALPSGRGKTADHMSLSTGFDRSAMTDRPMTSSPSAPLIVVESGGSPPPHGRSTSPSRRSLKTEGLDLAGLGGRIPQGWSPVASKDDGGAGQAPADA